MELERQLESERKANAELTEKLHTLRPPIGDEKPLSVKEIITVPEIYLGKELLVEGMLSRGTVSIRDPISNFMLQSDIPNFYLHCYFMTDQLDVGSRRLLVSKMG